MKRREKKVPYIKTCDVKEKLVIIETLLIRCFYLWKKDT